MSQTKISIIIPTRDRPEKLMKTLACLKLQDLAPTDYEIIVVDDGSSPAVTLPDSKADLICRLVRTPGLERSAARNRGAAAATGNLLVFVDDDITVEPDFLATHLRAHGEWSDALAVGVIRLPEAAMSKPFARFRQKLEQQEAPRARGITPMRNFCAAANMSIPRDLFRELGGFDSSLASGEDQDLALRHSARAGQIAFLPEAVAIHNDNALEIRSYCRRAEWGSLHLIPFCRRYPDWPDNVERERVNGPVRWWREPILQSGRKAIKLGLTLKPIVAVMFGLASALERLAPNSLALDRVYRLLLGAHVLRGYRKGRKLSAIGSRLSVNNKRRLAPDPFLEADR